MEFTLEQLVACVDRELGMRARVYPRWVSSNPPKLTQRKADEEMEAMRQVRAALLRGEAFREAVADNASDTGVGIGVLYDESLDRLRAKFGDGPA